MAAASPAPAPLAYLQTGHTHILADWQCRANYMQRHVACAPFDSFSPFERTFVLHSSVAKTFRPSPSPHTIA